MSEKYIKILINTVIYNVISDAQRKNIVLPYSLNNDNTIRTFLSANFNYFSTLKSEQKIKLFELYLENPEILNDANLRKILL